MWKASSMCVFSIKYVEVGIVCVRESIVGIMCVALITMLCINHASICAWL